MPDPVSPSAYHEQAGDRAGQVDGVLYGLLVAAHHEAETELAEVLASTAPVEPAELALRNGIAEGIARARAIVEGVPVVELRATILLTLRVDRFRN